MIPQIIHYCWFGGKEKPDDVIKCINSWKKFCPSFSIIEWNENNYCISDAPIYVQEAIQSKKYAFATDYIRLDVVNKNGGLYFDTDVELIADISFLLENNSFFGLERSNGEYKVNTGIGFGSTKKNILLEMMMNDYHELRFIKPNGEFDILPCPERNSVHFINMNYKLNNHIENIDDNLVLPTEYMCPLDQQTGILNITNNTVSIHHYLASWFNKSEQKLKRINEKLRPIFGYRISNIITEFIRNYRKNGLCYAFLELHKFIFRKKEAKNNEKN